MEWRSVPRLVWVWSLLITLTTLAAPRAGTLHLRNGDRITGHMAGFDNATGLLWKHPAVAPELRVEAASVQRVSLLAPEGPALRRHDTRVRLHGGDTLPGEVIGLDPTHLVLKTWYAGNLRIPRAAIAHLIPGGMAKVVFEGPTSLKGWGAALMGVQLGEEGDAVGGVVVDSLVENGPAILAGLAPGDVVTHVNDKPFKVRAELIAFVKSFEPGEKVAITFKREGKEMKLPITLVSLHWDFRDGAFLCKGVNSIIGRELDWPERANLEFTLEWEAMAGLDIVLCGDRLAASGLMNAYSLRINHNHAYLYRFQHDGVNTQSSSLGVVQLPALERAQAHFSIRIDRKLKTITLLMNDRLVQKWRDNGEFAGKGRYLQFNPQTANTMRVSNLRLSEWNGNLPSDAEVAAGGDGRQDFVRLANDDSVSGQIAGIQTGRLALKTELSDKPIEIPLDRIALVKFATPTPATTPTPAPAAAVPPGQVRATLLQQGALNFQLLEWKPEGVRIRSAVFGDAVLRPEVLMSLEWK